MRIAVSAAGPAKDSPAEERFGRCAYFLIFDDESDSPQVLKNEGMAAIEGAGIKTARILMQNGVDVVLTGRVGPKAMHALLAGGVSVYTGVSGTVEQSLEKYRRGLMSPLGIPNAEVHAGKKSLELVAE